VRFESENWRNWSDFEMAWQARFGDPDYQYALRNEISTHAEGTRASGRLFNVFTRATK